MIVQGSLNYTLNGRRRKSTKSTKRRVPFEPLVVKSVSKPRIESAPDRVHVNRPSEDYRKEISSKYTVAIAYNKGAYQVISPENIRDIGR